VGETAFVSPETFEAEASSTELDVERDCVPQKWKNGARPQKKRTQVSFFEHNAGRDQDKFSISQASGGQREWSIEWPQSAMQGPHVCEQVHIRRNF